MEQKAGDEPKRLLNIYELLALVGEEDEGRGDKRMDGKNPGVSR